MKRAVILMLALAMLALPATAGARIAYTLNGTLFIGDENAQNAHPVTGGVRAPHFTSTLNQLAFFDTAGGVSVVDVVTGAVRVVNATPPCAGHCTTSWSPDGQKLAILSAAGDLTISPVGGGVPTLIASNVDDFDFSPDSSQIAITRYNKDDWLRMFILPAAGGPERLLPIGYAGAPLWTPIGIVVYSFSDHGRKLEQSIKLIDPKTGKVKRKFFTRRIKRYRDTGPLNGQPSVFTMTNKRLLLVQPYRTRYVLRYMDHKGKALRTLTLAAGDNFRGQIAKSRLIVQRADGRLQAVSLKTGKSKTLVPYVDAFAIE